MPAEGAGDGYSPSSPGPDLGNVGDAGRGHGELDGAGGGPVDFFISYAEADVEWAEWVAWVLEGAGYTTRIQAWDFAAGSGFVKEMHRGAQDCARTIAVLSNAYLSSDYAEAEWQAAWASDPSGRGRKLLAARIEDCARPGLLKQLVSVDLFGVDRETAASRLLAAAHGARGKPAAEPAFPGATQASLAQPKPAFPGGANPADSPGRRRRRRTGRTRRTLVNAVAYAGGMMILVFAMILGVGGCLGGSTGGPAGPRADALGDSSLPRPDGVPDPQPVHTNSGILAVVVGQSGPLTGVSPSPSTTSTGAPSSGASAGSAAQPNPGAMGTSTPNPAAPAGSAETTSQQAPASQAGPGPATQPAASPAPTSGCNGVLLQPLLGTLGLAQC